MKKHSVVLDTNIVISSMWGGNPDKIMKLWIKGEIVIGVSQNILDEYLSVLYRFNLSPEQIEEFILLFLNPERTKFIFPKNKVNIIKEDKTDNIFLECAESLKADYIISGDKHLLTLKKYKDTKIVTPKNF